MSKNAYNGGYRLVNLICNISTFNSYTNTNLFMNTNLLTKLEYIYNECILYKNRWFIFVAN